MHVPSSPSQGPASVDNVASDSNNSVRFPHLRMSRPEKGVLLGLFLEHGVGTSLPAEHERLFEKCVEAMRVNDLVRSTTKRVICAKHVKNYKDKYAQPLTENGGRAMPYKKSVDGSLVTDDDGKPVLEDAIIERQDAQAPGTKSYWQNLVAFDEVVRQRVTSTNEVSSHTRARMNRAREERTAKAKRQRDEYKARREEAKILKVARENNDMNREDFKTRALRANLLTQQLNAAAFHAFTSAFCAANNQPLPPPLDLPNIPDLPQIEDVNVGSNSNTGAHNDTQPNVGAQENEYQQKEVGNGGEGTEIIDNSSGSV